MSDLRRILDVPRTDGQLPDAPAHVAELERRAEEIGRPMWDRQKHMLRSLGWAADAPPMGGFFEVPPGGGKTLVSCLAGAALRERNVLLIVPGALVAKATADVGRHAREFALSGDQVPKITSAEKVSLRGIPGRPDVIVIDEAHTFASGDSARARHLEDYLRSKSCRVVALSGTMGAKPCFDLYVLAWACLRSFSFLPLNHFEARTWGSVLDFGVTPSKEDVRKLAPLAQSFERPCTKEGALEAYKLRRRSTPGVVAYDDVDVSASLNIRMWRPEIPKAIKAALADLRDSWQLPDGTLLVDSLEFHRHADTLAVGFYNVVTPIGDDIDSWTAARSAWAKAVRRQICWGRVPGLVSPASVERACENGSADSETIYAWRMWCRVRDSVRLHREVHWVDQAMISAAVEKLLSQKRGLLWVSSKAVQKELARLGLPTYGAGTKQPEADVKHAALSIETHGTGKDLQAWDYNLVLEPPRGAIRWDQMLARTHRPGQRSDVLVDIQAGTWAARSALTRALRDAEHQEIAMGRQRLLYATWINGDNA